MEEYFQKALSHCIDIGMKQPCILCAVSPNGSVLAMRFNEGHDPDPLMEPFENDTFAAPLHIMVVDRDGKAMRVVINSGRDQLSLAFEAGRGARTEAFLPAVQRWPAKTNAWATGDARPSQQIAEGGRPLVHLG